MRTLKERLNEGLLGSAGLSKKAMIENWLKEMGVKKYKINPDMTIDVNGKVLLSDKQIQEFPIYIQFNNINGDFICRNTGLKSLRGCPKIVRGYFDCANNELTSLEHGPELAYQYCCMQNNLKSLKYIGEVRGLLNCSRNKLKDLEYCPQSCSSISCYDNELISLKGAPKIINSDFICSSNKLKNLEHCPEYVNGTFDCSENRLSSLEGCPKRVRWFFCTDNKNIKKKFTKEDVLNYCKVEPEKICI